MIETGSAAGKLKFRVFVALAEFERALILERTPASQVAEVGCRYGVLRTTLYKHVGVVVPRQ
ncbi:hypothetical protein [uncultured Stutzerimonas sp.]|uniref:hypothetical protein n=1 Tax=uncultured Stutzerimonas sp. TaxID=2901168 RepID=UPI0032B14A9F|tara:strand:+ start:1374 stop:1559 length:186 start_codon:yes stop_codon:yes gene_type:complete